MLDMMNATDKGAEKMTAITLESRIDHVVQKRPMNQSESLGVGNRLDSEFPCPYRDGPTLQRTCSDRLGQTDPPSRARLCRVRDPTRQVETALERHLEMHATVNGISPQLNIGNSA